MSSLQPMLVIGVGSTGQRIVNRLRQYLFAIFQDDLSKFKELLSFLVLETAHGTELDPALRNYQVLISTSNDASSAVTIGDLRTRLDAPLHFLQALGVEGGEDCNTYGGAGNIRFKGRISLWHSWMDVKNRIKLRSRLASAYADEINDLVKPHASDPENPDICVGSGIRPIVYVVGALGGGTCSGSYLDLAYMIRHNLGSETPVYGVFAVPESNWSDMDIRIKGNFYGSLSELRLFSDGKPYAEIYPSGIIETPRTSKPYDHVFLSQRARNDRRGTDLHDQVACKLLFDFLGMESLSTSIRVDHAHKQRDVDKYLHTIQLAGLCYPKYDLLLCAACNLSKQTLESIYSKGEVQSDRGKAAEQPANFHASGSRWIESKIEGLFEKFYKLKVGEKSSRAGILDLADELPLERAPEDKLDNRIEELRLIFKQQAESFLTDPELPGLGPEFLEKSRGLFLEWKNIRVIQHFKEGIRAYLEEIKSHWEKCYGQDHLDIAKNKIIKALSALNLPERWQVVSQHLQQDVLDGIVVETLNKGKFFDLFDRDFLSRISLNRPENTFQPYFDKIIADNKNNLTQGYKTIQKVNRKGRILTNELIDAEIESYSREIDIRSVIDDQLWSAWYKEDGVEEYKDPLLPFMVERFLNELFSESSVNTVRIQWNTVAEKLENFEKDMVNGIGIFTGAANPHEGHKGVKGVPKFLVARSGLTVPDGMTIRFGDAVENKNGIQSFPFLEDFMVFYEERTEFRLEQLKFWEESKQAFLDYPENYMCQTVPFHDETKMRNFTAQVRGEIEYSRLNRNLSHWLDGLEKFLLDFCFDWDKRGYPTGTSQLGILMQDTLKVTIEGHQIIAVLHLDDPEKLNPSERIPVYPECRICEVLLDKPVFQEVFLKALKPIFDKNDRSALVERYNVVRDTYPSRGLADEETLRRKRYFESSDDLLCVVDAFSSLYKNRHLLTKKI